MGTTEISLGMIASHSSRVLASMCALTLRIISASPVGTVSRISGNPTASQNCAQKCDWAEAALLRYLPSLHFKFRMSGIPRFRTLWWRKYSGAWLFTRFVPPSTSEMSDLLPLAGALAGKEGRLDRDHGERRRIAVDAGEQGVARIAVLPVEQRADAGHPLRVALVTWPVGVAVPEAVAADGRVNQAGINRAQRLVVGAEALVDGETSDEPRIKTVQAV